MLKALTSTIGILISIFFILPASLIFVFFMLPYLLSTSPGITIAVLATILIGFSLLISEFNKSHQKKHEKRIEKLQNSGFITSHNIDDFFFFDLSNSLLAIIYPGEDTHFLKFERIKTWSTSTVNNNEFVFSITTSNPDMALLNFKFKYPAIVPNNLIAKFSAILN